VAAVGTSIVSNFIDNSAQIIDNTVNIDLQTLSYTQTHPATDHKAKMATIRNQSNINLHHKAKLTKNREGH
jgi:hypothetical protein